MNKHGLSTYVGFFGGREYFLHMGFIHYLFGKHQLLEAVTSLFIFSLKFAVYFSCKFCWGFFQVLQSTPTLGWFINPSVADWDVFLVTQSNSTQPHLSEQHKEMNCLYTDQLKLIESWMKRDLKMSIITFSFVVKETETLIIGKLVWYEKKRNFVKILTSLFTNCIILVPVLVHTQDLCTLGWVA